MDVCALEDACACAPFEALHLAELAFVGTVGVCAGLGVFEALRIGFRLLGEAIVWCAQTWAGSRCWPPAMWSRFVYWRATSGARSGTRRGRRLIAVRGTIAWETVDDVRRQVRAASAANVVGLDVVLQTDGGGTAAAIAIFDFLTSFEGEIATWVPNFAHSMGTFLALNLLARGPVTLAPLSTLSPMDVQEAGYCRRTTTHILATDAERKVTSEALMLVDSNLQAETARLRTIHDRNFLRRVPYRYRKRVVAELVDTRHNHSAMFTAENLRALGIPIAVAPLPAHLLPFA